MPDPNPAPTIQIDPNPEEFYRFLANEVAFQRQRKQEVFAWASSLLVAIIGGVIALTMINKIPLALPQKIALTVAIAVLCISSWIWIEVHWRSYLRARDKLHSYYDQIAPDGHDRPWPHDYTGIGAIVALAIIAIVCVWASNLHSQSQAGLSHCCTPLADGDSGKMKAH